MESGRGWDDVGWRSDDFINVSNGCVHKRSGSDGSGSGGRTVYDRLQKATGKVALGEPLCYVCLLDHRSYTLEAWYKELIFNM